MEALPYYLALGMPYDVFWHGEPGLVKAYQKAHELWKAQKNQEMWIQGLYDYRAYKSVMDVFAWGLNGGKGSRGSEYPHEPIPLTEYEKKAAEERDKQRALEWIDEN